MGSHPNITALTFPRQSNLVGLRVEVVFHHDLGQRVGGTIVRDDRQSPFVTLIKLDDDDRYVEAGECQYLVDDAGDIHWRDLP